MYYKTLNIYSTIKTNDTDQSPIQSSKNIENCDASDAITTNV